MKIVDMTEFRGWYVTTEDAEYRTNSSGSNWERLYGASWESVWGEEEEKLIKLFARKMMG